VFFEKKGKKKLGINFGIESLSILFTMMIILIPKVAQ